jgi:hypothetical protein
MAIKLFKNTITNGEITIDSIFIAIYSIAGALLVISSVKTLLVKENRTLHNWLMILAILMTVFGMLNSLLIILVRIVTLLISIFVFDAVNNFYIN